MPNVPYLLVATKIDLRSDADTLQSLTQQGEAPIEFEEGQALAKEIGATAYLESSALTGAGVDQVFQSAVEAVFNPSARRVSAKKVCNLL